MASNSTPSKGANRNKNNHRFICNSSPRLLMAWNTNKENNRKTFGYSPKQTSPGPENKKNKSAILSDTDEHIITFAPTGAGKGTGAIIPALLSYPGSVITIDPKGENHAVTAKARKEMGQKVYVLDPFNITGKNSVGLNPLDQIVRKSHTSYEDAALLTELIIQGRTSKRDPFWDEMAKGLITSLLLHIAEERPRGQRNLVELNHLVNQSKRDFLETLRIMQGSKNANIRSGSNRYLAAETRVAASFMSKAQSHILFLAGNCTQNSIRRTSIDVDGLREGAPVTIYIIIPPHRLESHGKLLRLWIGYLMSIITQRTRRPEIPTLFILDEAAQLGPLSQLRQAVTLLRGYGLRTWSFWQDLSQLRSLYPHDWQTILNNCRTHQAFGIPTFGAAKEICDALGYPSPEDLRELPREQMLLSRAGCAPVIAKRPCYLSDKAFKGRFCPNPLYMPADARKSKLKRHKKKRRHLKLV